MGRVGILGPRSDEADSVARAVKSCGGVPVLIDTGQSGWTSNGFRLVLRGQSLDDIGVFYIHGIPLALPPLEACAGGASPTWSEQYAAERERRSLLHSTLRGLELDGRFFVNPVTCFDLRFFKLYQFALLSRASIVVPRCVGTDDPHEARAFASKNQVIEVKPLSGGPVVKRVTVNNWPEVRDGAPRFAPSLLQEYIEGEEFRVYILDGEPIAVFSVSRDNVADARQSFDIAKRGVPSLAALDVASRATVALELVFAAVDICVARDGSIVVLECDPTPAIGVHEMDGILVARLAEFLVLRS